MGRAVSFNPLTSITLLHLERNQRDVEDGFRKLASGLRIERAADDPAGLAVSERMRARIASQKVADRNLQDGISLVRTAESSLGEVASILTRMRELSIAALNGTASDTDVQNLQAEFDALASEIQRGVASARFNGIPLFAADRTLTIQAGADADETIDLRMYDMTAIGIVLQVLDLTTGADAALELVDGYVDLVSTVRGDLGSQENRMTSALRSLAVNTETLSAAESRIRDVDVARATADLATAQIRQQLGIELLARAQFQPLEILTLLEGALALPLPGEAAA